MSSDPVLEQMDVVQAALDELREIYTTEHPPTEPPEPASAVIRIRPGDDADAAFQRCLAENASLAAAPGEYRCNWTVPADYAGHVVITTDTDVRLAPGTRIDREATADLAVFRAKNASEPVLRYGLRSTGVHLAQVGIGPQAYSQTCIVIGTDTMTRPEDQPHDISFSHVLGYGDPVRGQHRAVMMGARNLSITDSTFVDYHEAGRDCQALAVWVGGQGVLVRNCLLEASAENVLLGGGFAQNVDMIPSDHRYERCIFTKNPAWKVGMQYPPQVKCHLEVKFARRVLVTGCLFEHNWSGASMAGASITIKVCSNTTSVDDSWITTEDVTLEHNLVRKVGRFLSVVGSNDGAGTTQQMRRLRVLNNLGHTIDTASWSGSGESVTVSNWPVEAEWAHNTILGCDTGLLMYSQDGTPVCKAEQMTFRDSVAWHGRYGIKGPGGMGKTALDKDIGPGKYLFAGNVLKRHPERCNVLPPDNLVLTEAPFAASLDEYYTVIPGSPAAAVTTTDGRLPGVVLPQLRAHNQYVGDV